MAIDADPSANPNRQHNIEQATLADLDAITDFQQPIYADTYPNDRGIRRDMFENNTFRQHMRDYLEEQLSSPDNILLLLRDEDKIVGTIGLHNDKDDPTTAEVWGFYVDTEKQGEGLGRKLWDSLMEDSRSNGIEHFYLTVAKDSTRAIRFYEANGFTVTGEEEWDWPSWTEEHLKNQYWKMEKSL